MRFGSYIFLVFAGLLPLVAQAAPPAPWLAVAEGSGLFGSRGECTQAARQVLENQGFVRVSDMGTTVMGAYRPGADYGFKAAIKCLGNGGAVAFVVTTRSGEGLDKANGLIAGLRQQGGGMMGGDDFGGGAGDGAFAGGGEFVPPAEEPMMDEGEEEFYEDDGYYEEEW